MFEKIVLAIVFVGVALFSLGSIWLVYERDKARHKARQDLKARTKGLKSRDKH